MKHESLHIPDNDVGDAGPPGDGPKAAGSLTGDIQASMTDIVTHLESRFIPAGETLGRLVDAMGAVLAALDAMSRVLGADIGTDSPAVASLLQASAQLRATPMQQTRRLEQVESLSSVSEQLCTRTGEITRILTMLEFYTVNLKITASGANEFMEFANDISLQLRSGNQAVTAFDKHIERFRSSLSSMQGVDHMLMRECARVIPKVPDELERQVGQLRARQAWLAQVAGRLRPVVLRLQGNVGRALEAMQIGDITRQRIEHLIDACQALELALADPQGVDHAGTRAHMLRLVGDQLGDLTDDFLVQTAELTSTLGALGPDCALLLGQDNDDAAMRQSRDFLRELGTCITDAHGMTNRLGQANGKAQEIAEVVVRLVDTLRDQAQSIESLRYDVDYMAINVNIRARLDKQVGLPVAVIADEMRICSRQMAEVILELGKVADELGEHSHTFETGLAETGHGETHASAQSEGVGAMLAGALAIIEQGASQSAQALSEVDSHAKGIVEMIDLATEELSICATLSMQMRAMTDSLAVLAGQDQLQVMEEGEHPVARLMEGLARSYTMVSERKVHNQHLTQGMVPLAGTQTTQGNQHGADENDDSLFDDALF